MTFRMQSSRGKAVEKKSGEFVAIAKPTSAPRNGGQTKEPQQQDVAERQTKFGDRLDINCRGAHPTNISSLAPWRDLEFLGCVGWVERSDTQH